jgi:hypothetical protein
MGPSPQGQRQTIVGDDGPLSAGNLAPVEANTAMCYISRRMVRYETSITSKSAAILRAWSWDKRHEVSVNG